MDHGSKEKVSRELQQQIEGHEILTKTETLAARKQVASEIEKAEAEAQQRFVTEQIKIEKEKEGFLVSAKAHFSTLLGEINRKEGKTMKEVEARFLQREAEILEKLLQTILP